MPRLPFKISFPSTPQHTASDKEIIDACLRGDKLAWDTLIKRYAALMYSTSLRMGLSSADSEDVVQDVCVILLDHLADVRDIGKLSRVVPIMCPPRAANNHNEIEPSPALDRIMHNMRLAAQPQPGLGRIERTGELCPLDDGPVSDVAG